LLQTVSCSGTHLKLDFRSSTGQTWELVHTIISGLGGLPKRPTKHWWLVVGGWWYQALHRSVERISWLPRWLDIKPSLLWQAVTELLFSDAEPESLWGFWTHRPVIATEMSLGNTTKRTTLMWQLWVPLHSDSVMISVFKIYDNAESIDGVLIRICVRSTNNFAFWMKSLWKYSS
jgi:hypothetical protein